MARTSADLVSLAKLWQQRLGIEDWPTVYRVEQIDQPQIATGPIDVVLLPADSDQSDVVFAVLLYAVHNVSGEQRPTEDSLCVAARELAAAWTDGGI
jgi:hypothetical protein